MADSSPLAGLLDCAGKVFSLANNLGRTFKQERGTEGGCRQIDPKGWERNHPAFNEFCNALLGLRKAMQNPPDGFALVAQALLEAARVAKKIRDVMQSPDGQMWQEFQDFYPQLNSVAEAGWQAVKEVTKARRLDDPFAFVDQPATGKDTDITGGLQPHDNATARPTDRREPDPAPTTPADPPQAAARGGRPSLAASKRLEDIAKLNVYELIRTAKAGNPSWGKKDLHTHFKFYKDFKKLVTDATLRYNEQMFHTALQWIRENPIVSQETQSGNVS